MAPSIDSVIISGATGMIGSALYAQLKREGIKVRRLVRSRAEHPDDIFWDPERGVLDAMHLEGVDAIVHLAGAPIAQRWSNAHKNEIRDSRILGTATLARAVTVLQRKPRVVLSGSAVGYYGDRGDEVLTEQSSAGGDFLAGVTREWEQATQPMTDSGVRVVHLRTGIVLSRSGGALAKLITPFQLGAGGPMGPGTQWMSWISLHDHLRAMRHAVRSEMLRGPVNLVSPEPTRNADFARELGRALRRPAVIPLPAFALELMFGEMARATLLAGQRVLPKALTESGFAFDDPTLARALERQLRKGD